MVAFFAPFAPYVVPTTMLDVIKHLGLESGLKLCLDAGDASSYASGQKWLDRSGGGYDFYLGTDSGATATDPTFNGVAGRQSSGEYFSFDGGDWFTYDAANEAWMNNIHKDSAKWAFAVWAYISGISTGPVLFGNNDVREDVVGFSVNIRSTGALRVGIVKGAVPAALLMDSTASVSTGAWHFLAGMIDEAAATGVLQIDAAQEDKTSTYTSPSASSATYTMQIGCAGDTFAPLESGSRIANMAMWESAVPTKAQLLTLYNASKAKFGL